MSECRFGADTCATLQLFNSTTHVFVHACSALTCVVSLSVNTLTSPDASSTSHSCKHVAARHTAARVIVSWTHAVGLASVSSSKHACACKTLT